MLLDVIHPFAIGRNEEIRRRAGFDLSRERVARAEGHDHAMTGMRLEKTRLLIQRLLEAGGGEYDDVGRTSGERRQRND